MAEVKISTSDKLDSILQKLADELGLKKAELVKNLVVKEIIALEMGKEGKIGGKKQERNDD